MSIFTFCFVKILMPTRVCLKQLWCAISFELQNIDYYLIIAL